MMKAVLYSRVSDESQVDTWSLDAQKRAFNDLCSQKYWQAYKIYCEEGVSAHTDSIDKRPQFKRLLDDCQKRDFDVVVVHSLDRWSRNLGVTLESFKRLANSGIAFVSITENIDYSTPEGKLFIAMLGAFAQYYSDSLSKHTSKGLKERALNGFPNGDVPFGYRHPDPDEVINGKGYIQINPEEAEAIKEIFQMYATGNHSLASLASWLNEKGFKTHNKQYLRDGAGNLVNGPRPFTLFSVRWLLHNPIFTGKVNYRGELHPGLHIPIIDEDLFNKVQERLRYARGKSRTLSNLFRNYLLKGIARCVYCGYPLWCETNSHGYTLYREKRGTRPEVNCPVGEKSISCNTIDAQVDQIIESLVLPSSWKENIIAKISSIAHNDQIIKERDKCQDKLRRLSRTYIDGFINDSEYEYQKKLLQDRLSTLSIPKLNATLDAGSLMENMGTVWSNSSIEDKHKLITLMLDAVYIDLLVSRRVVGILPKPIFYPLFETLEQKPGSNVRIYKPDDPPPTVGMVETGEGTSLSYRPIQNAINRRALITVFA